MRARLCIAAESFRLCRLRSTARTKSVAGAIPLHPNSRTLSQADRLGELPKTAVTRCSKYRHYSDSSTCSVYRRTGCGALGFYVLGELLPNLGFRSTPLYFSGRPPCVPIHQEERACACDGGLDCAEIHEVAFNRCHPARKLHLLRGTGKGVYLCAFLNEPGYNLRSDPPCGASYED